MPQTKYRIYELSARAVMAYGREQDGVYTFQLDRTATEKCKAASASHEQDGNALFFQAMCELHGNTYQAFLLVRFSAVRCALICAKDFLW